MSLENAKRAKRALETGHASVMPKDATLAAVMPSDTLTPSNAAAKIVEDHCPELASDRRTALIEAIEAAIIAWGDLTSSNEFWSRE